MLTFETLGMICPSDPHQRNPNAPKFEDRSQEDTEWQERYAREAAWKMERCILQLIRRNNKQHSSHLRRIHDRFQRDPVYRDSQLKIGWSEEKCIEMDKLAPEDHSYCASSEKYDRF